MLQFLFSHRSKIQAGLRIIAYAFAKIVTVVREIAMFAASELAAV